MITEVNIKDIDNSTISYLSDIALFNNKKHFQFKPGINIIVGKNGCGKSTLLNLIADYTLCRDSLYSKFDIKGDLKILDYSYFFNDNTLKDGIEVKGDYTGKVFRYLNKSNLNSRNSMNSMENFILRTANNSTGENILTSVKVFLDTIFNSKTWNFPIKDIKEAISFSNDLWKKNLTNLLQYYKQNHIEIKPEEYEYTLLMDEPDRNLDIDHIEEIYHILSYRKEQTQLIAVIHNPILINKLSKLDYINFIELTDNYINKINRYFN